MSISTKINSSQGVVSLNNSSGITFESNTNNFGFYPYVHGVMQTLTTTVTLSAGNAGLIWLSGSSAITVVMPDPTTCAGACFAFLNRTGFANIISSSNFHGFVGGAAIGTTLTLSGVVDAALSLICDGGQYIILGNYKNVAVG